MTARTRSSVAALTVLLVLGPVAFGSFVGASTPAAASPPQNLDATYDPATDTVHLDWEAPAVNASNVTGYRIYENGQAVASATNTSAVVDPLSEKSTYYVTAVVDKANESLPSNPANVWIEGKAPGGPCVNTDINGWPPVFVDPSCLDELRILIGEKIG